ncbi:hypothetical protein BMS3Bbin02_00491 [bacterium BMS3Bbin02]|nr:hypothetical protein BMS3Bbin02_00491 [bacterium BMS3Bbin02]
MPGFTDVVAIVVAGTPVLKGIANLLASRISPSLPIRTFDNQMEALGWLNQVSDGVTFPIGERLGSVGLAES